MTEIEMKKCLKVGLIIYQKSLESFKKRKKVLVLQITWVFSENNN